MGSVTDGLVLTLQIPLVNPSPFICSPELTLWEHGRCVNNAENGTHGGQPEADRD